MSRRTLTAALATALLSLLAAPQLRAEVMSASGYKIRKLVSGAGGGPGFTSGGQDSRRLSFALAQQGWAGLLRDGPYAINGGFYGRSGSGGGGRASADVMLSQADCPGSVIQRGSTLIGLPWAQSLCLGFSKLMLPATLSSALRVTRIRDKDAAEINVSAGVQDTYESGANRLLIAPSAGTWESNTLYRVSVGTDAVDQDGFPLLEPTTFQFLTLADPAVSNTFVAAGDAKARLRVPAGALPGPGTVDISTDPVNDPQSIDPDMIRRATEKLKLNFGPLSQVLLVREFNYFDAQGGRKELSFPSAAAVLSLPIEDEDGDGIVDGSDPPARTGSAQLHFLDETASLWVRLPESSQGPDNTVSGKTPHLSVFALITPQQAPVDEAYAYPVPFSPHGPNAGTGSGQTGTEAAGITFTYLPGRATIEVYNVRGERVWRGEESTGAGKLVWNVRNSDGHPVVSGVYVYVIKNSAGAKKTGKLIILK